MNGMSLGSSILLVHGTLNIGEGTIERSYGSKNFTSTAIEALPEQNESTLDNA